MAENDSSNMNNEDQSEISSEMIDFLRRKTFNEDLKSLVNKVVFDGNYPDDRTESPVEKENEDHEIQNLIKDLHSLFYRTINLNGYKTIDADFNPFTTEKENIYEYSLRYLKSALAGVDVTEYAILCYDPAMKSFVPEIFEIQDYDKNRIALAPEDGLYHDIIYDAVGVILDNNSTAMERIPRKHFVHDFEDSTIFLISIENILNIFWTVTAKSMHKVFTPTSLFPIFVAVCRNGKCFDHKVVIRTLQRKLSFAFYVIHNNLKNDLLPTEYRTPAFFRGLLDTYSRIYGHLDNIKCFSLTYLGKDNDRRYFFLNDMWLKIKLLIGHDSAAVQIEKNRVILFLSPSDEPIIFEYLNSGSDMNHDEFSICEIKGYAQKDIFNIMGC
jgi:hypothetical protein